MGDEAAVAGGNRWAGVVMAVAGSVIAAIIVAVISFSASRLVSSQVSEGSVAVEIRTLTKTLDDTNGQLVRLATRLDGINDRFAGLYTRSEAIAAEVRMTNQMDALTRRIDRLELAVQQQSGRR